ncbi:MAG: hypothetical protein AAGC65_02160 [Mucilaginibacter sp.]|uniref:hypothetical protein n=1 Tax=Mucilaginibacter sp. TaxID=1882438 RepID=UPI0031AFAFBE
MKKFPISLLLFFLLLSIVAAEAISTSVNLNLDGLSALLNVLLPLLIGIGLFVAIAIIFIFVRKAFARKIILIAGILINLALGCVLKIKYNLLQSDKRLITVANYKHKSNFYLASNRVSHIHPEEHVVIENLDNFLSNDHLVFTHLGDKWKAVANAGKKQNEQDHDQVTLRIKNNNNEKLIISKAAFSSSGLWKISKINNLNVDKSAFPIVIKANDSTDVTVAFTAAAIEKRTASVWWAALFNLQFKLLRYAKSMNYQWPLQSSCLRVNDELYLYTNDSAQPIKRAYLSGLWQYRAEGDWEPDLQKMLNTLNFTTNIGFRYFDNGSQGEAIIPNTDEVAVSYFQKADLNNPVKIRQLAAYHSRNSRKEGDTLAYYYHDSTQVKKLFYNDLSANQILLPKMYSGPNIRFTSFDPKEKFGLVMGTSNTDRKKNFKNKIAFRIWKAIDSEGKERPNSYIIGGDFLGQSGSNYDYQDNVYYIENVKAVYP